MGHSGGRTLGHPLTNGIQILAAVRLTRATSFRALLGARGGGSEVPELVEDALGEERLAGAVRSSARGTPRGLFGEGAR